MASYDFVEDMLNHARRIWAGDGSEEDRNLSIEIFKEALSKNIRENEQDWPVLARNSRRALEAVDEFHKRARGLNVYTLRKEVK